MEQTDTAIVIGAYEAKTHLSALLDRVENGQEVVITRHGRAVARLVREPRRVDSNAASAALDRLTKRREQLAAEGLRLKPGDLRAMLEQERR